MDSAEMEKIVNLVVERIWQRVIAAAPKQRVLMLFSGASTGYLVGMQTIRLLTATGHSLTVVLTESGRKVIGEEHVRQAGAEHILFGDQWVNTPKLVRETDLVLMPTLSMNTAAHLALGLMDSLFTTLVLGARLADKPVVAICDGANPYGNGGRVFSERTDSAPELRKRLAENLMTLAGYGIDLVSEADFLRTVAARLGGGAPAAVQPAALSTPHVFAAGGGVLTVADLAGCPRGAVVRVQPGTRISPLALETAGRLELRLVYE